MWNFNEGRGGLAFQWRKEGLFNKRRWKNRLSIWKKMNLDPTLTPFSKINSRWIRELKCQKQTLKLSVEKYRWISFRPWGKEGFLKQAQKVQTIKGKICHFDFMKIKKSCSSETFLKKMRK